jgi:pseudouridine-5'-phosphate glycosidase
MRIEIAPEVQAALAARRPVVALESTVIAHGLPKPQSLEVAVALERIVSDAGAVPATIAVIDGRPRVGLDAAARARLVEPGVLKASAADLGAAMAHRACAATTVSATAVLAARAGIRVFATGGIGGVHRGEAWDVSHDLVTLSRVPVAVVSSGGKSILDLPRTLEALETLGVPVVGFGTNELPAFYVRGSGLTLEHRVDTPMQAAALLRAHWDSLGLATGVLLANPIPEASALRADEVEAAVAHAEADAAARGVRGKALTPFLLRALAVATSGRSVAANLALLESNATVATQIAMALAEP